MCEREGASLVVGEVGCEVIVREREGLSLVVGEVGRNSMSVVPVDK